MNPVTILQATTPTFKMTLPETVDLTQADRVYFTLFNDFFVIEKTPVIDAEHHNVARVELEQIDTLRLCCGGVYNVRLQWTYGTKRAGTKPKVIRIERNEIQEVLPRGN